MKICELTADQLGALARNDVYETDGIKSVLPMHDDEGVGLVVEVEILTQEAPHWKCASVGARPRRVIWVVAESLDVADDVSFGGKDAFERGARSHCGILIDRANPFAQSHRRPCGKS